jgi:aconitate hydratase
MLALTFVNPDDYSKIRQDDKVSIKDFNDFAPDKHLTIELKHADGTTEEFPVAHTYNAAQIEWVNQGSALNKIRKDFGL